jgi:hypothetical protein
MSLYDDLFAEMATPLLQEHLAESAEEDEPQVYHWPLGNEEDAVAVTAIVDLTEEDEEQPTKEINSKTGRKIVRRGRLEVPSSLELSDKDKWQVRGELWNAVRIGARHADLVTVEIQRPEMHTTRLPQAPGPTP